MLDLDTTQTARSTWLLEAMFVFLKTLSIFLILSFVNVGSNVAFAFAPRPTPTLALMKRSGLVLEKGPMSYENINSQRLTPLGMSTADENKQDKKLPMLLDIGTKGGALFLSLLLFIVPIVIYEVVTLGFGLDSIEAGKWIGVGFTFFTTVLWVGSYVFRVATKDMTYVSDGNTEYFDLYV